MCAACEGVCLPGGGLFHPARDEISKRGCETVGYLILHTSPSALVSTETGTECIRRRRFSARDELCFPRYPQHHIWTPWTKTKRERNGAQYARYPQLGQKEKGSWKSLCSARTLSFAIKKSYLVGFFVQNAGGPTESNGKLHCVKII